MSHDTCNVSTKVCLYLLYVLIYQLQQQHLSYANQYSDLHSLPLLPSYTMRDDQTKSQGKQCMCVCFFDFYKAYDPILGESYIERFLHDVMAYVLYEQSLE